MSRSGLTKQEALELITPVADDEVDEELRTAFFDFIERNEDVRNKYESVIRLKEVVSKRCPCAKAPDRLHQRVREFLAACEHEEMAEQEADPTHEEPVLDKPPSLSEAAESPIPPTSNSRSFLHSRSDSASIWRYAAAAALLIAVVLSGYYFYMVDTNGSYNVEEHTYAHFIRNSGRPLQPTIATASMGVAEARLAEVFDWPITIPSLKNSEFMGVVLSDFIPDFQVPMLEYYLPSENQYIYIFAFNVKALERFENLARSREAVKSCVKAKDFYISTVNDKHVVSWKWDDTWYTAVSNHDGKTLASLVDSLQYERQ